jgi:deoxyadenosine/deoxycytidine kinase
MRVCLEGNLGAGKSAALDSLAAAGVRVVPEPVAEWGELLDAFYKDPARYGLAFSLEVLRGMARVPDDGGLTVVERSPLANRHVFSNMLYNDGKLSPADWAVYKDYHDALGWVPDAIVYLDVPTDVCMARVAARGRPCEAGVDVHFLRRVEFQYETMLKFANVPVVRVAGTGTAAEVARGVADAVAGLTRTLAARRPSAGA